VPASTKKDYWKVVDQCYLCDVCYMTKCPYVPPHQWNLDFPHLMLRAKAIQFKKGKMKFRDKPADLDRPHGKLPHPGGRPGGECRQQERPRCAVLQNSVGVTPSAWLPEFATRPFPRRAPRQAGATRSATRWRRTPGKVAVFATCYVNYNEPGIGHDLLKVLEHNEIPYVVVEKETCCGMPKLELGDLESWRSTRNATSRCWQAGAGGLRHRRAGAVLHPDVQAGAAADVPGRRRRAGGRQGGDVRSLRVLRRCATRTAC
jgi:glycerol-3-phosphate dehydrogenase subunit C